MTEFTPTPEQVKGAYIHANMGATKSYSKYEVYEQAFERMIAEVERAAAEKAVGKVRSEIRQIPRWWNSEQGYGEFDLQPLGPNETSEKGSYMEVMRVLDECAETYRRNGGEAS